MSQVTRECSVTDCHEPHRARGYCDMHWQRWRRHGSPDADHRSTPLAKRFWSKVDRRGDEECWPWLAGLFSRTGYGAFWVGPQNIGAHRMAYELLVGAIPAGLELDHLCHNRDSTCTGGRGCLHRRCVNPRHLEPTTSALNLARGDTKAAANAAKTHCPAGHAYDEANTYQSSGRRVCRTCSLERSARYWHEVRRSPEAVTNAAKTHCPQGHPLSGANLYLAPDGHRKCRECRRAQKRR